MSYLEECKENEQKEELEKHIIIKININDISTILKNFLPNNVQKISLITL